MNRNESHWPALAWLLTMGALVKHDPDLLVRSDKPSPLGWWFWIPFWLILAIQMTNETIGLVALWLEWRYSRKRTRQVRQWFSAAKRRAR